jgi:peptidoglycan/xylan/chitin deacetylase (PgdA/CDA1 family)
MNINPAILLSFDVEEFDTPLEHGNLMSTDKQLSDGFEGLMKVRQMLSLTQVQATFFTTANFAIHYPAVIREVSEAHEIGSHSLYHTGFFKSDWLAFSKKRLENITGKKVTGLRMPRMKILPAKEIIDAGYRYDASINPIWLPGRYNNLRRPRTIFMEDSLIRIPASVSTFVRIPLFWLTFKNLSYNLYLKMVLHALKRDGYVSLYFHPWEFIDLKKYEMPFYMKKPSGEQIINKMRRLITDLKNEGDFITMDAFSASYFLNQSAKTRFNHGGNDSNPALRPH